MATTELEQLAKQSGLTTRKPRSLWADAWRRLRFSITARIGMVISVIIILTALLVPIFDPYDAKLDSDLDNARLAPTAEHIMGTDRLGRDIFRRILHGASLSLSVGVVAVATAGITGTLLGLVSGYFGGWVDMLIMRVMDILLAFPSMLLAIAIVAIRGNGLFNTVVAISIVGIPGYARLVRSMVLTLREQDYILAAHMVGVRTPIIILRHILPNSLSPIIVSATMGIGGAILSAAALGFLGLGAQPPSPEWGAMIGDGVPFLRQNPHMVFFPGIAIMLTVLGFNLLGDGLRDALDPQMRT
ncbi:MAG: ABC transporter permease [Anaerolineaceae bacterium]|nr:ABC transporter permease [Anaerolineaceae bacterium]